MAPRIDQYTILILNRIYAAIDYMSNLEGQDSTLIIEMSQAMLNDFINNGELNLMIDYVKRYCDMYDDTAHAESIAAEIEA